MGSYRKYLLSLSQAKQLRLQQVDSRVERDNDGTPRSSFSQKLSPALLGPIKSLEETYGKKLANGAFFTELFSHPKGNSRENVFLPTYVH